MSSSAIRSTGLLIASLILALTSTVPASADVLVLVDGRVLYGEVVSQSDREMVFRFELDGIWTTHTFGRAEVDRLYREDGDQSDAGADSGDQTEDDAGAGPASGLPSRPKRNPNARLVAVIPLHGQVGGMIEKKVTGTFDATLLHRCLEEAADIDADLVVLDIQSPGGLVAEMEAICETILEWQDRLPIVAYPQEAYSAAAIITLCCRDIVVRPDSRIGAATIIKAGEGTVSALEAKFASPHYAKQKQYMQKSGHPYEVVAAMTIMETPLWWSRDRGFTTTPPADPAGWTEVDGRTTVLTMTADEAVQWGIARGTALAFDGVLTLSGVMKPVEILDLADSVDRHNRDLDRRLDHVLTQFNNYFGALITLSRDMNTLFEAIREPGTQEAVRALKREISRALTRIRVAGQQIERADRSILARRFEIPDDFLGRIEEDRQLLMRISRLLDTDTAEGWNEAAERLNEVIRRWREILGF